jgi:glycosyltransferase involved in cell wall biosynthesis
MRQEGPEVACRQIWVGGFPGFWGGADTELDHLIDLWRAHGVQVNLVPMYHADPAMVRSAVQRGCLVHEYAEGIFAGRIVASFCNQNFLAALPEIIRVGRPRAVLWFNCMTWLFDGDRQAHAQGWLDYFGFVSEYQERQLGPQLAAIGPYATFGYRPYFNVDRVRWQYREWDGSYRIGRISRDGPAKFAPDTWRIFDRVLVPRDLHKTVYVLGYGPRARTAIGFPPSGLDVRTWECDETPVENFYRNVDTMIHKTGGSRESYCRVVVEAYAHGVVPIVEDDYAFGELVVHGETGFRTCDSDEMSYLASMLAHRPRLHRDLAGNGRRHLETALVNADECWRTWETLFGRLD